MATAEQLKNLIKAHFEEDPNRFTTLALQVAAYEAKLGHSAFAFEIRDLVDKKKITRVVKLKATNNDLTGLILEIEPKEKRNELIVSKAIGEKIDRILTEFKQSHKLAKHGMHNRRKILLAGPPGTGKTMSASIIAAELKQPLFIILMDKLVTKFMGESSSKLRQIFEMISERNGVYFFDEFDTIGGERAKDNDVGEMRRVLNSFLHFIERDTSESLILAATNNISLLDQALFRRFDDVIQYSNPTPKEIVSLINNKLGGFKPKFNSENILPYTTGLSHAEITQACVDAIKSSILAGKNKVTTALLISMLNDKKSIYKKSK